MDKSRHRTARASPFKFHTPLVLLICSSAIPLAANRPWIWFIFTCLWTVWFIVLVTWDLFTDPGRIQPLKRLLLPAILFGGAVGWAVLQSVSWLPASWHHPSFALLDVPGSVSIDPERTLFMAWRLLGYGCLFWLVVRLSKRRGDAISCMRLLGCWLALISLYGLVLHLAGIEYVLWWEKWAYVGSATATFVNRNSFATYCGMGAVVCLGMFLQLVPRGATETHGSLLRRLSKLATAVPQSAKWWALGFGVCMFAVISTQSRAGLISALAGIAVLMIFYSRKLGRRWLAVLFLVSAAAAFCASVLTYGTESAVDRLGAVDSERNPRFLIYESILQATAETPFTGVGLGTFADAFKPYKLPPTSRVNWNHAHSTYLEQLFELGIPAALALMLSVGLVLGASAAALFRPAQRGTTVIATGIAAASVAVLHSAMDFSLQIPAITYAFVLCLALAWGQSRISHTAG